MISDLPTLMVGYLCRQMLRSMTGFGAAAVDTGKRTFTVEVRTLNSKTLDATLRLPKAYLDKELEVRNLIGQVLDRGKISVYVDSEDRTIPTREGEQIDADTIRARFYKLDEISRSLGASFLPEDLFTLAYQWPASPPRTGEEKREKLSPEEAEWPALLEVIKSALAGCDQFRLDEGGVLERKLLEYSGGIRAQLEQVKVAEVERLPRIRKRLEDKLADFIADGRLDGNRLEQEMIFHSEKLDVQEEIVRLSNHLDYFEQTILTDPNCGKKIGFISQEMGREINTIGSKSNDTTLQQIVVQMKDELEKIKEQSSNIL